MRFFQVALLLTFGFFFSLPSLGAVRCQGTLVESTPTPNLTFKIWNSGFSHPLYRRAGTQKALASFVREMELEDPNPPTSGTFLLQPEPGTTGLEIAGSFFERDGVLHMGFWQVQQKTRARNAFGSDDVLDYGLRPEGLNMSFAEALAAVQGAARMYQQHHPGLRSLQLIAQDIQSPAMRQMLNQSGYVPVEGVPRSMSIQFDF